MKFESVDLKQLPDNPFRLIGDQWTLVTAGSADSFNTMTASWGGVGVLWNKPVATIYIRPQRYTYEFLEKSDTFTLSFFAEQYRSALKLCGAKSGREIDKVKETGLTPVTEEGSVYFDEARLVFVCKKLYFDDIKPENFYTPDLEINYPNRDYHRMYIGEIQKALIAK